MSVYGWEIYDESGALLYDHSVIMSRMLGSYSVPWITTEFNATNIDAVVWSYTVPNIAFSGGTPYVFWLPTPGLTVPASRSFSFIPPDIDIGASSITLKYTPRMLGYADDTTYPNCIGGVTIFWGVYNS